MITTYSKGALPRTQARSASTSFLGTRASLELGLEVHAQEDVPGAITSHYVWLEFQTGAPVRPDVDFDGSNCR